MSAKKYRTLNEDEKAAFIAAVVEEGVNPRDRCPICRTRRQHREARFVYCDPHKSWSGAGVYIRCHACKVSYAVTTKPECCAGVADETEAPR